MLIDFENCDSAIADRMCHATGALFTAIAASVRVIMVKRIDRLYFTVAVRQTEMTGGTKLATPTNCTLTFLLL